MQKTKMIFTIGPASETEEILSKLINAGMSASRHNFSHGDHEEHGGRIELVKRLREKYNKSIAIILDTKGPEIRTGDFAKGKVELVDKNKFTFVCGEEVVGDETICSLTYADLYKDVVIGDSILVDDGLVGFKVEAIEGNRIHCQIKNSGVIGNHKGVNVPGVKIQLPSLTDKDIDDLMFGIEVKVDVIAASFIRKASDVLAIRKILEQNGGGEIQIFSKIENGEGVENIDEIIKFSDGIMVARGDMGVEIPIEQVPIVQKMIIEKCNKVMKPVITATQMLDSMMRNPRPTRAEVSDVANAIFDGTDSVMLSGETANGKYPVEAAETMARIAAEVENKLDHEAILNKQRQVRVPNVPNAISIAACSTALEVNATAIITATQTGNTARRMSRYRPKCSIIAVTEDPRVARQLALHWGVCAIVAPKMHNTDELIEKSVEASVAAGFINQGDLVIIAAGIPVYNSGTTNMLKVHIVGDILVIGDGVGCVPTYGNANVALNYKQAEEQLKPGGILVVHKLDEEFIALLDKVSAVIAEEGGVTSDMAVECISREIPLLCKAKNATKSIKTGDFISLDIARGIVYGGKVNIM